MPGAPLLHAPAAPASFEAQPICRKDLEEGDQQKQPIRAPLVQCLRTSGCVVFVAAAGLALYYLLAGRSTQSIVPQLPLLGLLAHGGGGKGLGTPPKGDDRHYQHTVLPNGLQVVNVQDKRAVQTAFAMAVEAGSFDDPKALPGLAHFCEHMLFLGTEQYPEASGFDNFMSANGGFNNAYTSDVATVYFGQMSQTAGKEGLDRFADFFRAPLFNKKYVSKEVHAIDSEHAKNVQDPQRRIFEVAFSLANPESPVKAFHTGDVETLYNIPKKKGIDPVEELKTYFNSHYCPEKMRLVTYGSESLAAQLAEAKKGFSSLKVNNDSCKLPRHSYAMPEPWGPKQMGRFVEVRGTEPHAELWLHFSLPDLTEEWRSQPTLYMDYVLGYGGQDSLSRVLQDNLGLVSSLSPMFDTNSAGTSLFVVMSLTKPGEKNLELVLDVFYSYLSGLRDKPVDEKLYSSLARINKLKWDWAEPSSPSDTASSLAEKMTRLPTAYLLSGDSLVVKPNSSLVSSLIKQLEPANMNIIFVNAASKKGNSSLDNDDNLKTLPHYGVKYSVQMLNKVIPDASERWMTWLTGTETPDLKSRLPSDLVTSGSAVPVAPAAIKGVPNEIALDHMRADKVKGDRESELYGARPMRIAKPPQGHEGLLAFPTVDGFPDVWYRSGWATHSPKAQLQLTLRPLKADAAHELPVRDSLRLSVFGNLLAEAMVPKMVDLTATGVSYSVDASSKGLSFTFGGFTPLIPQLIGKVLKEFNNFNGNTSATQSSRFKRVIQEIRQGLETWSSMPITYALQDRNMLLLRGSFSRAESLKALEGVTRESAASSVDDVLLSHSMQFTSLVMGNVAEQEANKAVSSFVGGLEMPKGTSSKVKHGSKPERVTPVVKITKPVEIRSKNPRPDDPNDAVVLSIVAGVSTVQSRVVLGILGQILHTVAYNELRTSRQLGYVVNAGTSQVSNVQYVSCTVQGNAMKADAVEATIEYVFTHLMPDRLANLTDKEFADYKGSFRQELLQPPQNFQEEISHFWGPVTQGGQCFDMRSNMATYLDDELKSKKTLATAWASLVHPTKGMRSKIAVKYFADSVPTRPTEEDAAATWSKQGVTGSALSLLRREYKKTKVFDHVDSEVREQLVKEGGYFPLDLNCGPERSATTKPATQFLRKASPHAF